MATLGTAGPRARARSRITPELVELIKLRADLGRLGNNLNQLTRLANLGDLDRPERLAGTLARIEALLDDARTATSGAL